MPAASQFTPSAGPVPQVIADAARPYVTVEYVGGNLGNFKVRGLGSLSYTFSAKEIGRLRWVLRDDAEKICAHRDFVMHHETRFDPDDERQRTLVGETVSAMLGTLGGQQPAQTRATARRGGRPRIDSDLQMRCLHLQLHCEPPWTSAQLAAAFIDADLQRPAEAMRTRMRRYRRSHSAAAAGGAEQCRYCAENYCPEPPDPPPDTY